MAKSSVWTVTITQDVKNGPFVACGVTTGRIKWNIWEPTLQLTSIPFSSRTDGYPCVKIPVLLRTHNGTLLAMAEARTPDCGDFSRTDLVVKRSTDNGHTWSALSKVVQVDPSDEGLCGHPVVIGNAAPVQTNPTSSKHPARIIVPFMKNNFEVWTVHSDDDGVSFSTPRKIPGVVETSPSGPDCSRNMSYFGISTPVSFIDWIIQLGWSKGIDPYRRWRKQLSGPWQFIGLGPGGSVQLQQGPYRGRLVVPAYHSYIRGLDGGGGHGGGVSLPISQLYNNFALGHVLISDDDGDTWRLGSRDGMVTPTQYTGTCEHTRSR